MKVTTVSTPNNNSSATATIFKKGIYLKIEKCLAQKRFKKNGLNCKIIVWIKTKRSLLARIQQGWCQDQSPRWSRKGCEAVFLVHTCQRWTNLCNQWRRHSSASNMLLSDSFDIPKQIKHLLLFPTCVTYFIYLFFYHCCSDFCHYHDRKNQHKI